MMFRPIRGVQHLACFRNRDVENALLVKQSSAQNRAKSVALSMAMRESTCSVYIYSWSLKWASVLHYKPERGARGLGEKIIA